MEAARAALRARILKEAGEQLAALNAAFAGRNYRMAQIVFETDLPTPVPVPLMFRGKAMIAGVAQSAPASEPEQAQDVSQKLILNAHIAFAALPPAAH